MPDIFSSHIFMFPFRFDWNKDKFKDKFDFYKNIDIDERVNFNKVKTDLEKSSWRLEPFNLKKQNELYNEYAYFYDYARDAIYNQNVDDKDAISYYFEKEYAKDATYEIKILKLDKPYILNITGLSLRLFSSGVGILSIELENRSYKDFRDILNINDFGRRIYPQYISNNSTEKTKNSFLADCIKITKVANEQIEENFQFEPSEDIVIGSHIMKLLGEKFSQKKGDSKRYYIQPILDDRMFVICWYGNDQFSKTLVDESYITDDDWYQFVFADNDGKTVHSPKMQEKLITEATYDRWMNYKYGLTLYGISRYSFVALTNEGDFAENKIKVDMHTMYFQMVTLLLATRASILKFSDEIAAVATQKDNEKLEKLYERYLTFYNRLYFKEVTHQDQGIELYDKARSQMKIDDHMEKLDGKFTKLFEFADLKVEKKRNQSLDLLTEMGAVFIPPSLLIALYSMGIFDYMKSKESLFVGLVSILLSALLGFLSVKLLRKYTKKHLAWVISLILSVLFVLIVYISFEKIGEEKKPQDVKIVQDNKILQGGNT